MIVLRLSVLEAHAGTHIHFVILRSGFDLTVIFFFFNLFLSQVNNIL